MWCISTMVQAAVMKGHDTHYAPQTAKRSWPQMWRWRAARGQTVCEKASHSMSRLYPCEVRGALALLVSSAMLWLLWRWSLVEIGRDMAHPFVMLALSEYAY